MTERPNLVRAAAMAYRVLVGQRIGQLPVDPLFLLRKCRSTQVMTYDEAADRLGMPLPKLERQLADAEAVSFRMGERHIVAYRTGGNPARLRFTLAHELGHRVLGHGGSSPAQEREADVFASYLLCPRPLAARLADGPGDAADRIARACYVSCACARRALAEPVLPLPMELTAQVEALLGPEADRLAENVEETSPKRARTFLGSGLQNVPPKSGTMRRRFWEQRSEIQKVRKKVEKK